MFTPDGDGFNDRFMPIGKTDGIKEFKMYIYNRWGEEAFTEDLIKVGMAHTLVIKQF